VHVTLYAAADMSFNAFDLAWDRVAINFDGGRYNYYQAPGELRCCHCCDGTWVGPADAWCDTHEGVAGQCESHGGCTTCSCNYYITTDPYEVCGPTSIELIDFTATAARNQVTLEWETATEPDNAGFNLWKAEAEAGPYAKITAGLIPAQGDATHGATYTFTDADVKAGKTYWYKLEDVSINGQSNFHGPVNATVPKPIFCGMAEGSGATSFVLFGLAMAATILAAKAASRKRGKPYRKPEVKTTSGDEVLRKLGPAQTCSPHPSQCPTSQ
jgi:hypothetical protein